MATYLLRVAVCICLAQGLAHSYELDTHELAITREAIEQSVLFTNSSVTGDLGLDSIDDNRQTFPDSKGGQRTIQRLIEVGARFEDSLAPTVRVLRHFYNPLTGTGLFAPSVGVQTSSPDWALAPRGLDSAQEFSYWDARQYLLDALTERVPAKRDRAFGLMFETLGRVVHHLQDMAQPQHVRNDVHCDSRWVCGPLDIYAPSFYEEWTNMRDTRSRIAQRYADPAAVGYDLTGAPFKSTFNSPRRFWHTQAPGQGSPASGKGMAEFAHRNFVSAGTNFVWSGTGFTPDPRFPLPAPFGVIERRLITDSDLLGPNQPLRGEIHFIASEIKDNLTGQSTFNPRAATLSIFDEELKKSNASLRAVTLNKFNFEAAYSYLIPRAVAHSAGLINYFFRGKLDVIENPAAPGVWLIRNRSSEAMKGTFAFYYDTLDGQRHPVPGARWSNVTLPPSDPQNPGDGFQVSFETPVSPRPKVVGEYMLVFSGEMGEEKPTDGVLGAVVGKYVAPPRSGFIVTPSYASADGISGSRLVSSKAGQWQLSSETGLVAGNIDWKGWYVNGIPTKVLTWRGPKSRYLRELPEKFALEVYQDGEVFAVAPKPVLGAALNADAQGRQWLVVITKGDEGEVVYRRPNAKSESPALYDAASNPGGWQEIGRITRLVFRVDRPWFFDGPGMEAQTVTTLSSGTGRLKLLVSSDGVATFSEIPHVSSPPRLDVSDRPPPVTSSTSSGCLNNTIQTRTVTTAEQRHDVENPGTGLLLAVDYDDTQELIAESVPYNVLYYRFKEVRTQERTDVFDSQGGKYLNCNSGIIAVTTGSDFYHSEEYNNVSFNNIQRLKFAGIQIDLNRPLDRMVEIKDQSLVGWVQYPSNPSQSTPGVSSSTTSRTRNSENNGWHFSYLNLRDRAALIYRQRSSSQSQFLNSVPVGGSSQADEQLDFHTAVSVTTYPLGSGAPGSITLGPLQISDYDVGYAKDLVGNELYSIRFPSQVFNRGLMFYFNHLTGAVLEDLIPPGGPQPLYVPVGLVK